MFRINAIELYPLYEKFNAIAGRIPTKTEEAIFVDQDLKYPGFGSALLDLSPHTLDMLVKKNKRLIPLRLLDACISKESGSLPWARLLTCYLFTQYFTVSRDGLGDYRILQVIEDIECGMTPFPLILAETIQGLDGCRTRRCSNLTGSPLLLQIWL